jgi:hypothetical protein
MTKKNLLRNMIAMAVCLAGTAVLSGCGASGGKDKAEYEHNEYLGKFPSIFKEKPRLLKELKEEMTGKMQSAGSEAKVTELKKQWQEREKAIEQEAKDLALAEWEYLRAMEVPFRMDYEDPDFKIISTMVEEADSETGALTINVLVEAKRDLQPSMNAALKYIITDNAGGGLFSGTINPFVNIQIITRGNFRNVPAQIKAGEYCCQNGSKLMLYCRSYDFTKFAGIVFVK